ncbi:MAG: hypothetical protein GY739_09030 [Mesoflavibacter sp.]|nr:hypothetical protein [Mesoflavibacter sp.]
MMVIFADYGDIFDVMGVDDNGTEDQHLRLKFYGVEHSYDDCFVASKKDADTDDNKRIANFIALKRYINKLKRENDKVVYDGVDNGTTKHPKLQGVAASFDNGVVTLKYSYLNSRLVQGTLLFVATVGSLAGGYFFGKKWC